MRTIVVGTGDRGTVYGQYAINYPEELTIIACADTNEARRKKFAMLHGIDEMYQFDDWNEIASRDKFADAVIITLPDHYHFDAASKFLELDYHVLLEKPIATTPKQVFELLEIDRQTPGILQICHVLRYTQFYSKIHDLVQAGDLGEIINLHLSENVGYYHYAHSFVRGNWRNRETSAPFILTKSSHDLDIMYWLVGAMPKRISSFGSQKYFGQENKPENVPPRCTDGCPVENECLYYAPRIYLDIIPLLHLNAAGSSFFSRLIQTIAMKYPSSKKLYPMSKINDYYGWPVNVITPNPTLENRRLALENGPYGRCVFDIEDHNIVDTQVVTVEFDNNVMATFNLHGHSAEEYREIRIHGTKATLLGRFSHKNMYLQLIDTLSNNTTDFDFASPNSGHGGGDEGIIKDFISNISKGITQPMTNSHISAVSHFMAFAVDRSRLEERTVTYADFVNSLRSI